MITVKKLTKNYGRFRAVNAISFECNRGDILGFLGANGAGKSTSMKAISGFIAPTAGDAEVGGVSVCKDRLGVQAQIGYLPESSPSYRDMTVSEFLAFIAQIRKVPADRCKARIVEVMEQTKLSEVAQQTIDTLSKGYRQRVGFAQALIHDPPVLILDEPTDGLDPNQKHEVRELIREMGKNKSIILSTHILEEMGAICNRTIIIHQGEVVIDSTPDDLLRRSVEYNAVRITFGAEPSAECLNNLQNINCNSTAPFVYTDDRVCTLYPKNNENIYSVVAQGIAGSTIEKIEVLPGKMDEVFRTLTT